MYIYEYRGNITGHKLIKSKYSFSRIQQQPKQMSFGYLVLNANNMIAFLLLNNNQNRFSFLFHRKWVFLILKDSGKMNYKS